MADMVADAALALAMEAQSSPSALRMTSTPCCAHRKLKQRAAADAGMGAEAGASAPGAAAAAAQGKEGGMEDIDGPQPPPVQSAGGDLAGRARLLHRILSSIYGSESAALDVAIFQTTVSLPGGVVGRVRLEHGGLVDVTSEDANLEMQLRGVVRRVGSVLYAKADPAGAAAGAGTEQGGEQEENMGIRLKPRGAEGAYRGEEEEEYGGEEEGYGEYGEGEEGGEGFGGEEEAAKGQQASDDKKPAAASPAPAPPQQE